MAWLRQANVQMWVLVNNTTRPPQNPTAIMLNFRASQVTAPPLFNPPQFITAFWNWFQLGIGGMMYTDSLLGESVAMRLYFGWFPGFFYPTINPFPMTYTPDLLPESVQIVGKRIGNLNHPIKPSIFRVPRVRQFDTEGDYLADFAYANYSPMMAHMATTIVDQGVTYTPVIPSWVNVNQFPMTACRLDQKLGILRRRINGRSSTAYLFPVPKTW